MKKTKKNLPKIWTKAHLSSCCAQYPGKVYVIQVRMTNMHEHVCFGPRTTTLLGTFPEGSPRQNSYPWNFGPFQRHADERPGLRREGWLSAPNHQASTWYNGGSKQGPSGARLPGPDVLSIGSLSLRAPLMADGLSASTPFLFPARPGPAAEKPENPALPGPAESVTAGPPGRQRVLTPLGT